MRHSIALALVLGLGGAAYAGPTAHIGREITKGVGQELKQEVQKTNIDLRDGAKKIGNGLADSVVEHGKELDHGARNVGREVADGFFSELTTQLGKDGKGPLATSMARAGASGTTELVQAVGAELAKALPQCEGGDRAACIDSMIQKYAYESSNAAARGAAAAASPLGSVLLVGAGFAAGLLFAALIALLINQRKMNRVLVELNPRTA